MDQISLFSAQVIVGGQRKGGPRSRRVPDTRPTGRELRDGGIELVLKHERARYKAAFVEAVVAFPIGFEFTAEDVRALIGDPPGHRNSMGGLFHAVAKLGLASDTRQRMKATRTKAHARDLPIWRRL